MTAKPIVRRMRSAWMFAALLSLSLGAGAAAAVVPLRAEATDVQVRVLVDVADLIFRSGHPYYYERGYYQPVVIEYDPWRRPVYYRYVARPVVVHVPPPPRYHVVHPPRPYYTAPPRHYTPAPPHYRTGYGYDDRHSDRSRAHHRDSRRGYGHSQGRGRN
ncbi:hypothetical protein B1992_05240 [Pseudoxanthomonas broegbernensis]|uniref:Uncharacterized protein n=1 Tax=Pseudoxanthomonas broegbernensis TaxID=83619 RepID=A0A7V8GP48_9GAMM|nr:hypothetical protein [Pseudoxanthomonas broegbernensis]KAF1687377.1 hypothetical protein B1992_05240 [Pseudoxanthomonas broegbernensis]MBB6065617.1 hypothetical protein [Pseudoxanthomonas broegbernensis]